ncbi:MADS-box transcription factor family protein [Striga asiatica]|uniref:MADS-box transcription factor family protein n=1 Tax=Striga asiatica TaxID=4170 RepID=A0A5A7NWA2_STRAF|nr:MADS-box transcription factor family protein [Striga asiatica]
MAPPPQGRKKSQGRRKIEMKLIADENARTVTFSKRRAGLFKKATELSILCGAHIAIIIFSLGGRAYSFAHPNVESVVGRFFNRNPPSPIPDPHAVRAHMAMLAQLKEECEKKAQELEAQKRRGKELEAALEVTDEQLSRLGMDQLRDLKERLEKLRDGMLGSSAKEVGPTEHLGSGKAAADVANVERGWRGVYGIPADWLKL